jgi:hypothetical protein
LHEDDIRVAKFFEENHVAGYVRSKKTFTLSYDNVIVAALSFRRPFVKKYGDDVVEIARFSNHRDLVVPGAFSKLFKAGKFWAQQEGYKHILTYGDKRFGGGKVYKSNGFAYLGETDLDYFYTDGSIRYNRFRFRARDGKSEEQIAAENNVYKIYGAGSKIYLLNL